MIDKIHHSQPMFPTPGDILDKKRLGHLSNAGETTPFGITLKQHMVIEFTKGFINSGMVREISFTDRLKILISRGNVSIRNHYNYVAIAKSGIDLANEVIKQLNEEHS